MNDSNSSTRASRFYEQHRVVVDKKDFKSWTKGSKCYAQLKVVDDIKDSRL